MKNKTVGYVLVLFCVAVHAHAQDSEDILWSKTYRIEMFPGEKQEDLAEEKVKKMEPVVALMRLRFLKNQTTSFQISFRWKGGAPFHDLQIVSGYPALRINFQGSKGQGKLDAFDEQSGTFTEEAPLHTMAHILMRVFEPLHLFFLEQ